MSDLFDRWPGTHGDLLGIDYELVEAGRAVASMAIEARHCNPVGVCHGGVLFGLADDSMGAAVQGLCPEGTLPTAGQVNIHYARSARPGQRITSRARVVSHGRRTAVAEARLTDEEDRLVALSTATFLFVATG